jgi:Zn-dependent protease with chaperone function
MKKIFLLLTILHFSHSKAQLNFTLDTIDKPRREVFLKDFELSNEQFIEELSNKYNGKRSKMLKKNLEEFQKEFALEIKERNFLFDERFQKKATEILEHFKETNSEVPKYTKILVSKNPSLNAYCLPNGTFVINMGLFYWLNNEDQVAGIIAHEISHKILEHSIKTQLKSIDDELSSKNKDEVRQIKKQKYNKSEKAFNLFKNKLYARGDIRKKHEYEADSLGYVLLKNTKFNKLDYIGTLRLMEKYDTIKPNTISKDIYKKLYNIENQLFNENWMKLDDFSMYDYSQYKEKMNKDSLSSHPETNDRIARLEKIFPELKNTKSNQPTPEFIELEKLASYNIVPNLMFFEEYGLCIYICMGKLQKEKITEEDKKYYQKLFGQNFQKIYKARKEYTLNRYLDRVEPKEQNDSYIQFLSFMWNLNLNEIKNIADFYSK